MDYIDKEYLKTEQDRKKSNFSHIWHKFSQNNTNFT